jgi:GNAT superfamily N-acetyltransferase
VVEPGPGFRIEPLGPEHERRAFSCGVPDLDAYLRERAGQDVRRHLATTFVLLESGPAVLGFYTLSQQIISLDDLPPAAARKLPRYPLLPATLIGRLAVHIQRRGQGLGSLLLMDALHRSWRAAKTVASYAVRVDATDEEAREFYLRCDFIAFPNERLKLFFPMADLDRRFAQEQ